jgi:hypothetical protein
MPHGKFHVGDHVNHAESQDGKLPGGTGFIVEVIPPNGGDGCKYRVKFRDVLQLVHEEVKNRG